MATRTRDLKKFREGSRTTIEQPEEEAQADGSAPEQPKAESNCHGRVPIGARSLPCRITEAEKQEAAQRLATAFGEMEDLEARKKEVTGQFKAEAEALAAEARRLSRIVRSEFEYRPVDCEKAILYEAGQAVIYRTDTGEAIEERPLSLSEQQTKMELEEEQARADAEADAEEEGEE